MAASDSELESAAEDTLNKGVKRYKIRSREVEYADPDKQLKALLTLRGLQSSRRGNTVGKIDRPG